MRAPIPPEAIGSHQPSSTTTPGGVAHGPRWRRSSRTYLRLLVVNTGHVRVINLMNHEAEISSDDTPGTMLARALRERIGREPIDKNGQRAPRSQPRSDESLRRIRKGTRPNATRPNSFPPDDDRTTAQLAR